MRFFVLALLLSFAYEAQGMAATRAIAVFTFDNLTGSEEHRWMGTGFAEALSVKLALLDRIAVRNRRELADLSRVEMISMAGLKEGDAVTLGRLSGCDLVIFGAIQAAGDISITDSPLRATARMVDVKTGVISRAIQVDGTMNELFTLQSRMALEFASLLESEVSLAVRNGMEQHGTDSLAAYKLYCEGLELLDAEKFEESKAKLRMANSKHPGILYAEAHFALGTAFLRSGKVKEMLVEFKQDAARLSPIWFNLGVAYERMGELEKANESFKTFVTHTDRRFAPWRYQSGTSLRLPHRAESGEMVLLSDPAGRLHAIDRLSGRLRWINGQLASRQPVTLHGDAVYFGDGEGNITCLNALTGELRWVRQLKGAIVTPVEVFPAKGLVAAITAEGTLTVLALADGALRWEKACGSGSSQELIRVQNYLCMDNGQQVVTLEMEKGETVWIRPFSVPGQLYGGLQRLFYRTEAGRLACLSLTDGTTLWEVDALNVSSLGSGENSSLGDVLLRHDGSVAGIDTSGKVLWEKSFASPAEDLVAVGDAVVVRIGSRQLIVLRAEDGGIRDRREFSATIVSMEPQNESLLISLEDGAVIALGNSVTSEGPSDLEGYHHMADILVQREKTAEAIALYLLILNEVSPGDQRSMHSLVRLYEKTGDKASAGEWLERARRGESDE